MKTRRLNVVDPSTGHLVMSLKFAQYEENGDWVAAVSNEFMGDVGKTTFKEYLTVRDSNE